VAARPNITIRFDRDSKTSGLALNCQARKLDNLPDMDTYFFSASAAVNPALPIMAHALCAGVQLLARRR